MRINNFLRLHTDKIFILAAVVAVFTAIYHMRYAGVTQQSVMRRHMVFTGINMVLIFLFLKRPAWFVYLFAILTVQQLYSHGSRFMRYLSNHEIDWLSVGVLVFMPFLLYLLILENRSKKKYRLRNHS
jgi:hypothetical protein